MIKSNAAAADQKLQQLPSDLQPTELTQPSPTPLYTPATAKRAAFLQSHYRKFIRQRLARRKAGGGNDASTERGLYALDFVDHHLPHQKFTGLLTKVLLSDLPIAYHTKEGINAFHIACAHGNLKVLLKIINSGVTTKTIQPRQRAHKINPRKRTRDGMSALHFTAVADRDAMDICAIVLDLMLRTPSENHLLKHNGLSADVPVMKTSNERLVVEILLQQADEVGLNVLGLCVLSSNKTNTLQYLLDQMPTENVGKYVLSQNITKRKQSLIHLTCYNSDYDTLMILKNIGMKMELNADIDGRTPLHHLCMTWRAAAVENHAKIYDLLKKEYIINQINRNTKEYITNQISCTTKLGTVQIKDFLEQKSKTSETALHLACNSGAVELAQILLTDGASLELKDRRGNTPITLLLRHRYKATRQMNFLNELLIARPHSWFDSSLDRRTGKSALIKAIEWRNLPALQIMLNNIPVSSDCIHFVDIDHKTAVHYCAELSFGDGLQCLLKKFYSDFVKDKTSRNVESEDCKDNGDTFGDNNNAKPKTHLNILEMQDNEGCTPLMLAIGSNDSSAVQIILDTIINCDQLETPLNNVVTEESLVKELIGIETVETTTTPPLLLPPLNNVVTEELLVKDLIGIETVETTTTSPLLQVLPPLNNVVTEESSVKDLIGIETTTQFPLLAKQLIEYQNNDGLTPLQCSALLPDATIMKLLLAASVKCNCSSFIVGSITKEENNILHCSAAGGSVETAIALCEFDLILAKTLARERNQKGKTPSSLAGYWKKHKVREVLLNLEHDKKIVIDRKNRRGSGISTTSSTRSKRSLKK